MSKVFRYFECNCGNKFNAFVPRDTSNMESTNRTGVYRIIPGAETKPEVGECPTCKAQVVASSDPNGRPPKFYFNYMES